MERHAREPGAGHDRAALAASERNRARTLVEVLRRAGVETGGDPALAARRRELEESLRAKVERALSSPAANDAERERRARERQEISREIDLVDARLRAASPLATRPGTANLEPAEALGTPELQALLGNSYPRDGSPNS